MVKQLVASSDWMETFLGINQLIYLLFLPHLRGFYFFLYGTEGYSICLEIWRLSTLSSSDFFSLFFNFLFAITMLLIYDPRACPSDFLLAAIHYKEVSYLLFGPMALLRIYYYHCEMPAKYVVVCKSTNIWRNYYYYYYTHIAKFCMYRTSLNIYEIHCLIKCYLYTIYIFILKSTNHDSYWTFMMCFNI